MADRLYRPIQTITIVYLITEYGHGAHYNRETTGMQHMWDEAKLLNGLKTDFLLLYHIFRLSTVVKVGSNMLKIWMSKLVIINFSYKQSFWNCYMSV